MIVYCNKNWLVRIIKVNFTKRSFLIFSALARPLSAVELNLGAPKQNPNKKLQKIYKLSYIQIFVMYILNNTFHFNDIPI